MFLAQLVGVGCKAIYDMRKTKLQHRGGNTKRADENDFSAIGGSHGQGDV